MNLPTAEQTAQALDGSIAHWERMMAMGSESNDRPIGRDCALCRLCVLKNRTCEGCPVCQKTGRMRCAGTPYAGAAFAWEDSGPDSREFKAAAKLEIDFLKSLKK